MNDQFKAVIQIAYDLAKGNKELESQLKKIEEKEVKIKASYDGDKVYKEAQVHLKKLYDLKKQYQKIESPTKDEVYYYEQAIKKAKELYTISRSKTSEPNVYDFSKRNELLLKEIQYERELSSIISKQVKSQTYERVSGEKKVQAELDKTAKKMQAVTTLNYDKTQLNNRANSFINSNPKLGDELINKIKVIQSSLKDVDAVGFKNLKKEFGNITSEAQALGQVGDTVFSKLNKNIFQFLSFMGSATIVMSGIRTIQGMIAEVKNLDRAMISLKKVTDETDDTYKKFINSASSSAKALGSSVSDIVEMTATWAKLGYTIQEASKLAEVSTVYANVGEINNTEKAVGDLVTVMKAYGIESKNAMEITDKFNEIGNKYATDAASLGEGISNAASSLALAGNSLDESLAMLTSMTEITQNASESGNALKILAMRLRGMKGELEELGEESEGIESISKIQTQILNLTKGKVNIFDDLDPTKFKSTYDIMLGISKVYKDMAETDQAELLEIIAGKQRGNSIAALLTSMSQAESVLKTSIESTGSAMREQQEYMKGIEYSADRMKASFQELASNTINSGWIKAFYDISNVVLQVVDNIGLFNVALVVLAGVVGTKTNLGLNALTQILTNVITKLGIAGAASTALSTALSTMIPAALIVGGIAVITKAYDHFNITTKELIDNHNKSIEKSKELASEYKNLESSLESLESKQNDVSKKLKELYALRENQTITASEISYLEQLEQQNLKLEKQIEYEKVLLDIAGAKAEKEAVNTMSEKTQSSNFTTTSFNGEVKYDLITDSEKIKENTQQINALNREMKNYESVVNGIKLPIQEQERYNNQLKYYRESYERGVIGEEAYKENVRITQSLLDGSLTFEDYTKKVESFNQKQEEYIQENESLIVTQQTLNDSIVSTSGANYELKVSTQEIIDKAKESAVVYSELEKSMQGFNGEVSQLNVVPKLPLDISAYEKEIDKLQESLKSLQTAKEKLNKEELTSSDVLDLLQSFPMLSPYIDLTAEGFGNLAKGLKDVSNVKVDALVSDLGEIRDSLSDADKLALDTLVNIISNMGEEAVSSSDKIKTLSEAIEDLKSSYDVFELAKKDIKEIGEISIDTIGKLNQTYPQLRQLLNSYLVDKGNEKELLLAIQGIYKDNEQVYRETIANQEVMTVNFINELNNKYGVGIQNHATFAKARLDIETELISTLGTMWSNFYDLQTGELIDNDVLDTISKYAPNYYGNLQKMEGQVKAYTEIGNRVKEIADSVSFSPASLSGGKKGGSKDKKEFSQVIDWISVQIEKLKEKSKKAVDDIGKYISYKTKNKKIDIAIQTKIKEQDVLKGLQDKYNKAAENVKLPKKYQDLVNNGGVDIEVLKGESGEKIAKQIDEYTRWKDAAKEVGKEIEGIADEIKKLNQQKLDNIKSYFDMKNGYVDSKISKRESLISLKEAQGKNTSKSDYNYLIELQNDVISNIDKEYKEFEKLFNQQVKDGLIKKGSSEYYDGLSYLNSLTSETRNANAEIMKYKAEIREIDWKSFDKGVKKIANIKSELSDLSSLISGDLVNEDGSYTNTGITQLGIYAQQISNAKNEIGLYSNAISKLQKELKNGSITQEQYNEELSNYQSLQRQASISIKEFERSIIEMNKKGIEAQTEAFRKLTQARKDDLSSQKASDDYAKKVKKSQDSIDLLKKKIAALALSTDRKDIAQRLALEKDLKEKESELNDIHTDHDYDTKVKALDDELKSYEKTQDAKLKALDNNLSAQEQAIKTSLSTVQANYDTIFTNINTLASQYGMDLTSSITSPWETATTAVETYKQAIAGLGGIGTPNSANGNGNNGGVTKKILEEHVLGASNGKDNSAYAKAQGLSELNQFLMGKGYQTITQPQMAELAKLLGISGVTSSVTSAQKKAILAELKKIKGFKSGTSKILKDQLAWTQEDGDELIIKPSSNSILTPLSKGDGVINADLTKNLMEWGKIDPLKHFNFTSKLPELSSIANKTPNVSIHYDNLLNVEGSIDKSIDVQKMITNALDKNNATIIKVLKQKGL